ncbi:MAG: alpha-amylase family glycosyl hydrolase, partial [Acidobacteriota bacterium]
MGADLHGTGASFRVWAPHASKVHVAGQWNGWSADDPLAPEGHGIWSAWVDGATVGHEYKFVIDGRLWRNDPYAREVVHSNGNSVLIDPSFDWHDFQLAPHNQLVIYELHAGTFHDRPGGGPGTFSSLTAKLRYLRALGVNALQVLPAAEFPGGFSMGYNPAHLFAIERDYGGPKAFRRFVDAAHQLGMGVIFDVVYNHIGPGDDVDLVRFDGWWSGDHPDGIYFYDRRRIATPWGAPRPDYGRPDVRRFLIDNALYWLHEHRVDGLRVDATAHIHRMGPDGAVLPDGWRLLREINEAIARTWRDKITIAEDLRRSEAITRPLHDGGAGFDTQWDPGFVHPIRHNLVQSNDGARDLDAIASALEYDRPFERVIYSESHDECSASENKARLSQEIEPLNPDGWFAMKRTVLGAVFTLTAPGIPMIFQGQEFLEAAPFDDHIPLDWRRRWRYEGLVQLWADLIRLRRNTAGVTRGLTGRHIDVYRRAYHAKLLAYHRWHEGGPGDDVVVVVNLSNRAWPSYRIGLPHSGIWHTRFNSDWRGYNTHFHDTPSHAVDAGGI